MRKFYTPYGDKDGKYRRNPVQYSSNKPSLTRQEFKEDSDINRIIKTFAKTGMVEHQSQYNGQYGEFAAIDYHEALNTVIEANEMFDTVPSAIRKRFENNPQAFLEFVTDDKNRDEMVDMGLIAPEDPIPDPVRVEMVNALEPAGEEG